MFVFLHWGFFISGDISIFDSFFFLVFYLRAENVNSLFDRLLCLTSGMIPFQSSVYNYSLIAHFVEMLLQNLFIYLILYATGYVIVLWKHHSLHKHVTSVLWLKYVHLAIMLTFSIVTFNDAICLYLLGQNCLHLTF